MQIILATQNAHKVHEISALLATVAPRLQVIGLDAFPDMPEPPEDQDTFEGNALQKARFVFARTGLACVADDSGLEVDALQGAPGVHSKRFTPEATAASNNIRLLAELLGRTDRAARFRCALAVVCPVGERTAAGACEGVIGTALQGAGGFGYDPLFWPSDCPGRTMAELTTHEKNQISHRGLAFTHLPALMRSLDLIGS
jgi:XTP/dITP diphosphohydrolase